MRSCVGDTVNPHSAVHVMVGLLRRFGYTAQPPRSHIQQSCRAVVRSESYSSEEVTKLLRGLLPYIFRLMTQAWNVN